MVEEQRPVQERSLIIQKQCQQAAPDYSAPEIGLGDKDRSLGSGASCLSRDVHMAVATSSKQTSSVLLFFREANGGEDISGPEGAQSQQGERFTRKPCMLISVD